MDQAVTGVRTRGSFGQKLPTVLDVQGELFGLLLELLAGPVRILFFVPSRSAGRAGRPYPACLRRSFCTTVPLCWLNFFFLAFFVFVCMQRRMWREQEDDARVARADPPSAMLGLRGWCSTVPMDAVNWSSNAGAVGLRARERPSQARPGPGTRNERRTRTMRGPGRRQAGDSGVVGRQSSRTILMLLQAPRTGRRPPCPRRISAAGGRLLPRGRSGQQLRLASRVPAVRTRNVRD